MDLAIVAARRHLFYVVVPLLNGEIDINLLPCRITVWYQDAAGAATRLPVLPNPIVWLARLHAKPGGALTKSLNPRLRV